MRLSGGLAQRHACRPRDVLFFAPAAADVGACASDLFGCGHVVGPVTRSLRLRDLRACWAAASVSQGEDPSERRPTASQGRAPGGGLHDSVFCHLRELGAEESAFELQLESMRSLLRPKVG
jgi:hypothetical protein